MFRILLALLLLASTASAQDYFILPEYDELVEPNISGLLIVGSIVSVLDYFGHITIHEGMHSLTAMHFGAEVTQFTILPTKEDGEWHMGYMRYEYELGTMNNKDHALVSLSPHYLNMGIMGVFILAYETGIMPTNKYAKLSLAIIALGAALDTGTDVLLYRRSSDVFDGLKLAGLTRTERAGARIGMAALSLFTIFEACRALCEVFFGVSPEIDVNEGPYAKVAPGHVELGWRLRF